MSQESNKEPALVLEVGGGIDAAVYIEKEAGENGCKQACPDFLRFLFLRASHAREAALRSLPLWYGVRLGDAVFSAEKTSGKARRCGGTIVKPPRALAVNNRGRPMAQPSHPRSG